MTSEFWRELGSEHQTLLDRFGLDAVKRVQALRYFNWRWTPDRLRRGTQGRYILARTTPLTWLRAALTPMDLGTKAWAPTDWPLRDRWLYVTATRLLWEVARKQASPAVLDLPEPLLGGPLPVRWRGRLISQDLANTAFEVASIVEALDGRVPTSILEIGAGYGRTAFALLSIYPTAEYTVVDIPPALDICRWYLSSLFPDRRIRFVDGREGMAGVSFDLALSISSLAEMTRETIAGYVELLRTSGKPGAVAYLKQWARWRNPVDGIELTFDDYVPSGRAELFRRTAPVQSDFVEAAWEVA